MMQNLTGFASKKSSCSAKSSTWFKKVIEKMMIANKRNKNRLLDEFKLAHIGFILI